MEWLRDLHEREDNASMLCFLLIVLSFWLLFLVELFSRCCK